MSNRPIASTFVAQVHEIKMRKDGGGRITLEFGSDGLEDVQLMHKISAIKKVNFQIAAVPIGKLDFDSDSQVEVCEDGNHKVL